VEVERKGGLTAFHGVKVLDFEVCAAVNLVLENWGGVLESMPGEGAYRSQQPCSHMDCIYCGRQVLIVVKWCFARFIVPEFRELLTWDESPRQNDGEFLRKESCVSFAWWGTGLGFSVKRRVSIESEHQPINP
jgi:hypothetical protein